MKLPCRHCQVRPATRARNLCARCYLDLDIRALYPPLRVIRPQPQTMAELDALEAEQRKCLPDWWMPTADDPSRVCRADALEFLHRLPDDGVDLLFTSPPYELARTYGIGERMVGGQKWVDWMVAVVKAAAPKVKGLIAIVCEGQTRGYRYSCTPFLLVADLHRAGFNLRKPCVYERDGIPGSGGPDWLKNRWEPIVCVTRPGRLPWSDNTACGHAPIYGPGGMPSYRTPDGRRVNGSKEEVKAQGVKLGGLTSRTNKGERVYRAYFPPEMANPGNIIDCGAAGGSNLGDDHAHDNEAPFPLKLAEFFVRSFCPPGGIVCDPFMGSGTVGHAAVIHGRRFVGCDVRQSQVDLTARRLAEPLGTGGLYDTGKPVVADLFDHLAPGPDDVEADSVSVG